MTVADNIVNAISVLLKEAGSYCDNFQITRIHSGGNNKAYHVISGNQSFFVKHYFTHDLDTRDRLASDYDFSLYAALSAPGMSSKPFAKDNVNKIALYEFSDGESFLDKMLTESDIVQAANFFCQLNGTKNRASAKHLPIAAEACFSVQDHFSLVANRLTQLKNIEPTIDEDYFARGLISHLDELWQEVTAGIDTADGELTQEQRCLSPSDFGFHNALKMADGSIRFIDFEYAGWDDPAKMVGDFFAQIAIPVPDRFFNLFVQKTMASLPNSDALVYRAEQLRLVYRIKWCCIALNIFLPQHMARRKFAHDGTSIEEIKRTQLHKATLLIQTLGKEYALY